MAILQQLGAQIAILDTLAVDSTFEWLAK